MGVLHRYSSTLIMATLTSALVGCAAFDMEQTSSVAPIASSATTPAYTPDSRDRGTSLEWTIQPMLGDRVETRFVPNTTHKTLNDYASQLAMKLLSDSHQLTSSNRVAVTSFVVFDDSLRNATIAGNQLAEHLMSHMQSMGVNMVDFKLTDTIVVNQYGDLVFSRDVRHLAEKVDIDAILTGTLMQTPAGIEVNARIITLKERRLLASSQLFIPGFMLVHPLAS